MDKVTATQENVVKSGSVKRPIRRSLFVMMGVMLAVLCILTVILSNYFFATALYSEFNVRLTGAVTYIENNADGDDLENCIKTGEHSAKYDEFQLFLNNMIDDLGFDYIYIVIPKETVLVNVISATNAAEFAAGEDNMPLLEETDAYTPKQLAEYRSFWDADDVEFFEETSDYGSYYTACKPLRNSKGETVALICVDLLSSGLRASTMRMAVLNIATVLTVFLIFAALFASWLHKNVMGPLRRLQNSTGDFAEIISTSEDLSYAAPDIKTQNEVESLSRAIYKMANDIRDRIKEKSEAEARIRAAETENILLVEKAAASAKIAEISRSLSTLLNNMPALAFYKDAETGEYVACNQSFAEYACKPSPDDVIGLTDFEIFDEATARHFVEDDKKALSSEHSYITLETVPDASGAMRFFQTTKLKFIDSEGNTRLLGMCVDLTEMAYVKHESEKAREAYEAAISTNVTYTSIARALFSDYEYIYYVNIDTEHYTEYLCTSEEGLLKQRSGTDFFAESRKDAAVRLHKSDSPLFIDVFTKENVLKQIDADGAFIFTYRLIENGSPVYVTMKATRLAEDPQHIIIGVNNVDSQIKDRQALERLQAERTTYDRITALSGDFLCVYTVDPVTDHYVQYGTTEIYGSLGIAMEGNDFYNVPRSDDLKHIYPDDREIFRTMITKENIAREIKEHGLFTLNYRILVKDEPVYVMLKAALVQEKDGPQIIVGVINIDAQVKREQEYVYNLSVARTMANIDALTGVKNKHAYIDAEANLNAKIENGEPVSFAIAVFDVNDLKTVNDTLGHRAGDEYIRSACMTICREFKHSPVYRVGGDEFAVITQSEDYDNLEEITARIENINRSNVSGRGMIVACGAAKYTNERNVAEVFEKADKEMYKNKRNLKS